MHRKNTLDLSDLGIAPGMPGLTPARATSFVEAAAVCFEENGHFESAEMSVAVANPNQWRERTKSEDFHLKYPRTSNQVRSTNKDLQDAAEEGACAVAISIVLRLFSLQVLERSYKGTGFDYWIGQEETEGLQGMERLEVSGILSGSETDVKGRVKKKLEQVARGSEQTSNLPQCVVVVEFGRPQTRVIRG
jgi:hypothetical protein